MLPGDVCKRENAGRGYLYLLQEREFFRSGEDVYKVGRTDRDVFARFKEYSKGSRLLFCQHVPLDRVKALEDEVKARFRRHFRSRVDVGSESFVGQWHEMVDVVVDVVREDRDSKCVAHDVVRRTGCRPAEYDAAVARFLQAHERELEGRLVPIEELAQMFRGFETQEAETGMTQTSTGALLTEPFLRACRDVGAVAHESLSVQFRAPGENSLLDASMRFREFAMVGGVPQRPPPTPTPAQARSRHT